MARAAKKTAQPKSLEQRLWEAADALRGNQEPSEYKHVVLGLVFLKYISDDFEARRRELEAELIADGMPQDRLDDFLEARDEYASHNVFTAARTPGADGSASMHATARSVAPARP